MAAIAVVLSHAGTLLALPIYLGHAPLHDVFRAGHGGVDFFFVLSGFIICTVHRRDIGRPSALAFYAWKRMTRIYPAYWLGLALLLLFAALHLTGDIGLTLGQMTARRLLMSVTLLPSLQSPLLGVAWTLQHEMLFYLLFGVAIANRRLGVAALAVWFASASAVALFLPPEPLPWAPTAFFPGFLGAPCHLQFCLGAGVAWLVDRRRVPFPRVLCVAGGIGLLLAATLENHGTIDYLGRASQALFGIASAFVLAGAATAERRGSLAAGGGAVFLGAASYAIYLVHVPVMAAACLLLSASGMIGALPGWLSMAVLAAAGVGGGILMHVLLERPVLGWLRGTWHAPGLGVRPTAMVSPVR